MPDKEPPNPGSPEAMHAGCTCPIMDNGHGRGSGRTDEHGKPLFWISAGCPLHWPNKDEPDKLHAP